MTDVRAGYVEKAILTGEHLDETERVLIEGGEVSPLHYGRVVAVN